MRPETILLAIIINLALLLSSNVILVFALHKWSLKKFTIALIIIDILISAGNILIFRGGYLP